MSYCKTHLNIYLNSNFDFTEETNLNVITCHLLDAFIQSDFHTQYCGQSPQEQFGVKCLRDTTTC